MKLDARALLALSIVIIIGASAYAVSLEALPYGGGGEIGSSISVVKATGDDLTKTWYPAGQHSWPNFEQYSDLDGNFEDYKWTFGQTSDGKTEEDIQLPGVIVESGYPYYLEYAGKDNNGNPIYRTVEDQAVVEKSYEKTYVVNGEKKTYRYLLLNYGVDVTIKTDADRYNKKYDDGWSSLLLPYGWNYEKKDVDVDVLLNFGLTPWVPTAEWNGSYKIVGGWAGIIGAQVYQKEQGFAADYFDDPEYEQHLAELDGAIYSTDSVIQSTNSLFTALNMYLPSSKDIYQEIDFESPDAIVGVKNAVRIEVTAQLGAGAKYITDALGHWSNIAVQNVFVTYHIVAKLVATIELKPIVEGDPIRPPDENNQLGDPPPVPILSALAMAWNEFWADVVEFWTSPIGIMYAVLILLIIAGVVYFLIKVFARRGG